MTVGELKDILDLFDDDYEVRIADQPSWPFEYSISDIYSEGPDALHLATQTQLGYLPGSVAVALGWREESVSEEDEQ